MLVVSTFLEDFFLRRALSLEKRMPQGSASQMPSTRRTGWTSGANARPGREFSGWGGWLGGGGGKSRASGSVRGLRGWRLRGPKSLEPVKSELPSKKVFLGSAMSPKHPDAPDPKLLNS